MNNDCFTQNRSLKSAFEILNKKQLGFLLSLSRLFIINNSSLTRLNLSASC